MLHRWLPLCYGSSGGSGVGVGEDGVTWRVKVSDGLDVLTSRVFSPPVCVCARSRVLGSLVLDVQQG